MKKIRTQVQLDEEDYLALKSWAGRRGISISAAVRWLVRDKLRGGDPAAKEAVRRFQDAAGGISSRRADEGEVSVQHDRVLYGDDS